MSSIDEINTGYLDSILKEEYEKRLNTETGASVSIRMFEKLKNSNKFLEALFDKDNLKKLFQNDKKYYIFFDDLERCTMDLSILLGYINHLTEQENNNVIVIANENEMGKSRIQSNLEQKYMVSLLANKLEVQEPNLFNLENNSKITEVKTVGQLLNKTDAFFNNDIEFIYKNFKEKTFGKTITFLSKIETIYDLKIKEMNDC